MSGGQADDNCQKSEYYVVSKGAQSRGTIVAAAKRLIALKGYQKASIQKVADQVGLSQSAVMHHFPTKMSLFIAVLEDMIAINQSIADDRFDPGANALDRFLVHYEVNYRWGVEMDYHAQIMTGLFHFASYESKFNRIYSDVLRNSRAKVHDILLAGVTEGLYDPPQNTEVCSEVIHDGLLGMILTAVASKRRPDEKSRLLTKWKYLIQQQTGHEVDAYFP